MVDSASTLASNSASATGVGNTSASKAQQSVTKLNSDFNFFLKMLTTQLQNQDPTEPMDVSQMTQQIAQYSSVEQQVQTNSNLEKLLAQQNQSQLSTAVSYIGKEVETEGNTGTLDLGQATFSYSLPKEAGDVEITISNSKGQVVYKGDGATKAGRNTVVWDGTNSFDGDEEPAGLYTISVKAKDAAGEPMTAKAYAVGVVNAVETAKDGTIKLSVGEALVDYTSIMAVRERTPLLGTNNAS